jgi:hypothetical protein
MLILRAINAAFYRSGPTHNANNNVVCAVLTMRYILCTAFHTPLGRVYAWVDINEPNEELAEEKREKKEERAG